MFQSKVAQLVCNIQSSYIHGKPWRWVRLRL